MEYNKREIKENANSLVDVKLKTQWPKKKEGQK